MSANEHYTLKSWNGYPQWQCNYCPFDTTEGENVIVEHVFKRHLAQPQEEPETSQSSLILVADKRGREKKKGK
jgi:hypothetical protein